MSLLNIAPSDELYNKVRGGFITQGRTLREFCREHGCTPTNAREALMGSWNGPKARSLRVKMIEHSGIATSLLRESKNHSTPDKATATEAEEFFYWGC